MYNITQPILLWITEVGFIFRIQILQYAQKGLHAIIKNENRYIFYSQPIYARVV